MFTKSGIYQGSVRHRRFSPVDHKFSYNLYMLAIDLDETDDVYKQSWVLGQRWFNPLRIKQGDHFKSTDAFKQNVLNKVNALQNVCPLDLSTRVVMVTQARCFGLYFSPINFYFCYPKNNNGDEICRYMLAEVSNTPWNQKHYYLIDLDTSQRSDGLINKKVFHVSPFMQMDMEYRWKITPPNNNLLVHIENWPLQNTLQTGQIEKVFDATVALKKVPMTHKHLIKLIMTTPVMTAKIFAGIYWQALKLFIKKVPFIGHPETK